MNESEYYESAMSNAYKTRVAKLGKPISEEKYKGLRDYAMNRNIRISGFRNYVGDIETIKTVIDDIREIAEDFPKIIDERNGIVLETRSCLFIQLHIMMVVRLFQRVFLDITVRLGMRSQMLL